MDLLLTRLPATDREALRLTDLDWLTQADAAAGSDCPPRG